MPSLVPRFRPSLTKIDITTMLRVLSDVSPEKITPEIHTLYNYLRVFSVKINLDVVAPTHSAVTGNALIVKQSIEEKLGITDEQLVRESMTNSERMQASYDKWCITPLNCSVEELGEVQAHRYLSNMMTEDEEAEYTKGM